MILVSNFHGGVRPSTTTKNIATIMKQLVIFDLDGTLLDTIGDLAAACDEVLRRHELPTYSLEEYKAFVGSGIMRLVERAIPEELRTEEFINVLRKDFVAYYFENISENTIIYKDVEWMLHELEKRGVAMAIASNKFQEGTSKLVNHFFGKYHFEAVLGQRAGVPLKPSPQIIYDICQITTYTANKILYVGDSGIDIETAKAAGVESVGVTWGFRSKEELVEAGADHIVSSPKEIIKLFK